MDISSQVSIDLHLGQSQLTKSSKQMIPQPHTSKRHLNLSSIPKNGHSKHTTEHSIGYNNKQNAINLARSQQIEDNKQKFSEMMDLPYIIINNDFVRRAKTFKAFKKVYTNDEHESQGVPMQNVLIKRTSPLQEIETSKKLGNVFFRKKKLRQTGTLYSCELWSRQFYDHILNKTELKQMHEQLQESSKCKNYDERTNDLRKIFEKWQKQQPNFGIDPHDYLITNPKLETKRADNSPSQLSDEALNSSKKSRFFKNVLFDHEQEDDILEQSSYQEKSQKDLCSITNRTQDSNQQSELLARKQVNLSPLLQPIQTDHHESKASQSQQNNQKTTHNNQHNGTFKNIHENKKNAFKIQGYSNGFLSERFSKRQKEQNTTLSTNQSSFFNEERGQINEDKNPINKLPQNIQNNGKYKSKIKSIFSDCRHLIDNCKEYQVDCVKIKKQINEYLNEREIEQQFENKKKLQIQAKKELSVLLQKLA